MINNLGGKIKTNIRKLGNKMYDNKWKILAGVLGTSLGLGMKYGLSSSPNDNTFVTPNILAQMPSPHQIDERLMYPRYNNRLMPDAYKLVNPP